MAIDNAYFDIMEGKIPHGKTRTRFAPSPTGYTWATCAPRFTPT